MDGGAVASGLYGISKKMKLATAPTIHNGYENSSQGPAARDPGRRGQSDKGVTHSKRVPVGAEFTDHFIRTRELE